MQDPINEGTPAPEGEGTPAPAEAAPATVEGHPSDPYLQVIEFNGKKMTVRDAEHATEQMRQKLNSIRDEYDAHREGWDPVSEAYHSKPEVKVAIDAALSDTGSDAHIPTKLEAEVASLRSIVEDREIKDQFSGLEKEYGVELTDAQKDSIKGEMSRTGYQNAKAHYATLFLDALIQMKTEEARAKGAEEVARDRDVYKGLPSGASQVMPAVDVAKMSDPAFKKHVMDKLDGFDYESLG